MSNKFILRNAKELFESSTDDYFKRYDLSNEWSRLNKRIDSHKKKIGREPFIYELIDDLLIKLQDPIKNQVKDILFRKDNEWFFKIGQYFFYNTYQWIKNLENCNMDIFLENWCSKFIEIENNRKTVKKDKSFPKKILLELTNNCNLNCVMCGVGKNDYDPSKNFSLDLLDFLSKTVLFKADLIRLNGLGESTILPNFLDYLNILGQLPAQLEIVTNLIVSNNIIWEKLIENKTNFLISCDSSSASLFESIRRGAKFYKFKKNLQYIGKNILNPLQGQIIFTLMKCNIQELFSIVELAAEMGLGGVIVNVVKENDTNWMYQHYEKIKAQFQKSFQLAESNNIELKLPDHIGHLPINKRISNPSCQYDCNNPWEEIYIRYNGDLTVCNMLNPYIYGNCQNYSFEEIWNGVNAELFKTFVNTKYRHYYCKNCYYLV